MALDYLVKSLEMRKSLFDANHEYIARSMYSIGHVYYKKGEYKLALDHCNEALDIRRKIYPKDHPKIEEIEMAIESIKSYQNLCVIL